MLNAFRDVPDQFGGLAALTVLAIDLQVNLGIFDVASIGGSGDRADRCGVVKAFADIPRATEFFGFVLQVAARHVKADGVTVDVLHGVGRLDVFAAGANRHHQLDLMVEILRQAGVRHVAGLAVFNHDQGIGGFEEKERWLAARETHFLGVFFVVATYAVNAVDGKALCQSDDGDRNRGRWRENKTHDALSSLCMPSARCTGRSEKLNNTQPSADCRRVVCHDGITK